MVAPRQRGGARHKVVFVYRQGGTLFRPLVQATSERKTSKQASVGLEFNVGAALSNDDAAGFRLKYTQLTLNWPAPIMGPAYRRVFIRSTRMYGRAALFFPRFTTRRRSWLASGTQINEFLRRVARAYPQIRARDQHVWPSWSRGKFAPRIVLYLSKNVVNAVRRIFYFFLHFFYFFFFFPLRGQTLLFMEIFDTPGKIKNISRSSSERCNGIERKIIPSRVPETIIPRHVVGEIFSYVSLPAVAIVMHKGISVKVEFYCSYIMSR